MPISKKGKKKDAEGNVTYARPDIRKGQTEEERQAAIDDFADKMTKAVLYGDNKWGEIHRKMKGR